MMKVKRQLWSILLLSGMLLSACHVTRESTLETFNKLPISNASLIAMVVNENHGSSCNSYIVEAIYHTQLPMTEFISQIDFELSSNGWERVDEISSTTPNFSYVSYELGEVAGLSIDTEVTPYSGSSGMLKEAIDMTTLVLPEGYPLDNTHPEDGYFLLRFYYHPYPPNECSG